MFEISLWERVLNELVMNWALYLMVPLAFFAGVLGGKMNEKRKQAMGVGDGETE